ncbi:hypothetical protein CYLTODRAFT_260928 [Cylindrobasidium torrendii FP15055 ss-10]|uniref:Uncharacterized protein n=1 Tax=Cylindrobasidium torrendii FP15055 ss-10 TaxID=1314674 RepID=A0A0D7BE66_9AGAR|nr:hypothetical protein CYLTODRAFT_260928 [Cylindrobasidium torrendii FP15055 ss-10]
MPRSPPELAPSVGPTQDSRERLNTLRTSDRRRFLSNPLWGAITQSLGRISTQSPTNVRLRRRIAPTQTLHKPQLDTAKCLVPPVSSDGHRRDPLRQVAKRYPTNGALVASGWRLDLSDIIETNAQKPEICTEPNKTTQPTVHSPLLKVAKEDRLLRYR